MLSRARSQEDDVRLDIEMDLLDALDFSTMNDRQYEVSEAHQKTFSWLFDHSLDDAAPWKSFMNWLHSGDGIYWVSGKAGSGKSTLMRHIYDHKETNDLLETWASPTKPTIASFFSGTVLPGAAFTKRSFEGFALRNA
jgi:hypothetical protein